MRAKATVRLKSPETRKLETVFKSLQPEVNSPASARSRTSLAKEGDLLVMMIEARDSVALRAALNAYLRWIDSILDVLQTLEKQESSSVSR